MKLEDLLTPRRMAALVTLVPLLTGAMFWVDARYLKAHEGKKLQDQISAVDAKVDSVLTEVKVQAFTNKRSVLQSEQGRLQSAGKLTNLEAARLTDVTRELSDLEKEIDRIRAQATNKGERR